jgi:hypothetical protein
MFPLITRRALSSAEIPVGWGALVESDGLLTLRCKPVWHETLPENRLAILQRIAAASTRTVNRRLEITLSDVIGARARSCLQ